LQGIIAMIYSVNRRLKFIVNFRMYRVVQCTKSLN